MRDPGAGSHPCSQCEKRWPTRWCPECKRGPDNPNQGELWEPEPEPEPEPEEEIPVPPLYRTYHRYADDTEARAAEISHGMAKERMRVAREFGRRSEGVTGYDLEVYYGKPTNVVQPAITYWYDLGYLVRTGHKRPNQRGNDCRVYKWQEPPRPPRKPVPIIWACSWCGDDFRTRDAFDEHDCPEPWSTT